MEPTRLTVLEQEMERLRGELYQTDTDPRHLSEATLLPISKKLDALIVEYYKEKKKQM
ncbi:hypothetical protein JIR001_18280 [Polycladomyces abyssicola]|jgi:hypothetical protein|uniref:Spo0E like sporulation regulatory protein n=1 Tax=Polycladomyces abyssicola TaxID=1125966 RepID=A0A8D5UHL2_9BACL|nr:aspartyl-phosphate phosphatase Spo0E family protein [Polycladomyces abyssicola]BCU82045.1 hypothetical protein JIR001_18280 [Polycladomyces abyssicola]